VVGIRSRTAQLTRIVASLAALAAAFAVTAPAAHAESATQFGVYAGAGNPSGAADFERWSGMAVSRALDYVPGSTWADIESPTWALGMWESSGLAVTYSVPLIPDTGGTVTEGATGAYNVHFVRLAESLVAAGQEDAVLRLGWEFNGGWYRWSAKSDPTAFGAYWREIVTAMRGVPGARFKFDWCPVLSSDFPLEQAYPGDAYVDYIGMDVYDQDWHLGWQNATQRWQNLLTAPYGLRWQRDFAAAHGKPMTYPEWALIDRADGHGGGDNPYFIQKMREWIGSNPVAYALYFEHDTADGASRLGAFPQGAAKFRELFGAKAAVPPAPLPPAAPLAAAPPPAFATASPVQQSSVAGSPKRSATAAKLRRLISRGLAAGPRGNRLRLSGAGARLLRAGVRAQARPR
jgi:hypothetical protein